MLRFPKVEEPASVPKPRMSLEEYAAYSEFCVENNSRITPENCLERGKGIRRAFTFKMEKNQSNIPEAKAGAEISEN